MAEFEGDLNLNVETSEIEVKGKFKLTEEELDKVAGGSDLNSTTTMECSNCHTREYWFGYFVGKVFDCPNPDCKQHTLVGIAYGSADLKCTERGLKG